ncbi:MAG: hypothetical protein AAFV80_04975 [Bacteroidota bacterium]
MKAIPFLFLLGLVLFACTPGPIVKTMPKEQWVNDTIRYISYAAYDDLKLDLQPITETTFNKQVAAYMTTQFAGCGFDRLRLTEFDDCNEVCESWVRDTEGRRFYWPSDYDAGIRGGAFSPDCKRYFVFSTFDGPDFDSYYEHRAQLFIFDIKGRDGVNSLQPAYRYVTTTWSIDDMTWVNNSEISLKVYSGAYWTEGEELEYSFYKAILPK